MEIFSADDLVKMRIETPKMIVEELIPAGLTILAGRPKIGKSWLAMNVAVAVATGVQFLGRATDGGDVLYLALEDTKARLQDRLRKLLVGPAPRLALAISCPALGRGGENTIEGWIKRVAAPRLVVVDVLQKIRPEAKGRSLYDEDYNTVAPLKRIADEHGVAVIAVTHTRKADPGLDPLDAISATTGLAGAADHNVILDRGNDGLAIYGRGRDVEEFRIALEFDAGRFEALGDPGSIHRSATRSAIIEALEGGGEGLGPKEIAQRTGIQVGNIKQALGRMVKAGEVAKRERGVYSIIASRTPAVSLLVQ